MIGLILLFCGAIRCRLDAAEYLAAANPIAARLAYERLARS